MPASLSCYLFIDLCNAIQVYPFALLSYYFTNTKNSTYNQITLIFLCLIRVGNEYLTRHVLFLIKLTIT